MSYGSYQKGLQGESLALDYLKSQGLFLLEQRYRVLGAEIDLIMRHGQVLVFVEVRYRQSQVFGGAKSSIDARKQTRIQRVALSYLKKHFARRHSPVCRFDVLLIQGQLKVSQIEWIQGAFY